MTWSIKYFECQFRQFPDLSLLPVLKRLWRHYRLRTCCSKPKNSNKLHTLLCNTGCWLNNIRGWTYGDRAPSYVRCRRVWLNACANEWNAKLALAFCNECSQGSPKAKGLFATTQKRSLFGSTGWWHKQMKNANYILLFPCFKLSKHSS